MKPSSPILHASLAIFAMAFIGCANQAMQQNPAEFSVKTTVLPEGTTAPRAIKTVAPEFPFALRRDGISGVVQVTCLIDETGAVREVTADDTSDAAFRAAALAAVKKWTFTPGKRDGEVVAMRVRVPVVFSFTGETYQGSDTSSIAMKK